MMKHRALKLNCMNPGLWADLGEDVVYKSEFILVLFAEAEAGANCGS
jgi:hypothetical protein